MTVGPVTGALATFLADGERSVWLTTAKLFVRAARTDPGAVEAALPALRDRLADDEFYFVRARSAEALGLVALEDPDAVTTPDVIAELLLGLEFDEPGVKAKLAKALEHVAVGDPERLTHKMANRAAHLDDEVDVVTGDD